MARAAQSSSNRAGAVLALVLALCGCTRAAPELPPDRTSVEARNTDPLAAFTTSERALSCAQIDVRLRDIARDMDGLEHEIASNRGNNQALGYFSAVLFPPLLLATEGNHSEKNLLDENQKNRDRLIGLRTVKNCPGGSDPHTGRINSE